MVSHEKRVQSVVQKIIHGRAAPKTKAAPKAKSTQKAVAMPFVAKKKIKDEKKEPAKLDTKAEEAAEQPSLYHDNSKSSAGEIHIHIHT